jgi:hypothetical protein
LRSQASERRIAGRLFEIEPVRLGEQSHVNPAPAPHVMPATHIAQDSNRCDNMVGQKPTVCRLNCYSVRKEVGLRCRVLSVAVVAAVATLAAACDTGYNSIPLAQAAHVQRTASIVPDAKKEGLYVNEADATSLLGYNENNRNDAPPICSAPYAINSAQDVAVDDAGDVIVPQATGQILIGQGPKMCGPQIALLQNPFGAGIDASSTDALNGSIAVSTLSSFPTEAGGIAVCSVAAGCTRELTNAATFTPLGVALDREGNCWLDAVDLLDQPTLTEFPGCAGGGIVAKNFVNQTFGGIEIDKSGNLLTFDVVGASGSGALDVYRGCNPRCKLVSSNALVNPAYFGHLNASGDRLAVGAFLAGQVDIYSYSPRKLTYLYSFDTGLSLFDDVLGVTYNRRPSK